MLLTSGGLLTQAQGCWTGKVMFLKREAGCFNSTHTSIFKHSLKLTAVSKHLKMDGWLEYILYRFPLAFGAHFQGQKVSFREGTSSRLMTLLGTKRSPTDGNTLFGLFVYSNRGFSQHNFKDQKNFGQLSY